MAYEEIKSHSRKTYKKYNKNIKAKLGIATEIMKSVIDLFVNYPFSRQVKIIYSSEIVNKLQVKNGK